MYTHTYALKEGGNREGGKGRRTEGGREEGREGMRKEVSFVGLSVGLISKGGGKYLCVHILVAAKPEICRSGQHPRNSGTGAEVRISRQNFFFLKRRLSLVLGPSADWSRPTHLVEDDPPSFKVNYFPHAFRTPFAPHTGHCLLHDSTITQPLQEKEEQRRASSQGLLIREGPIPQVLLEETGSHDHPSSKGGRKEGVKFSGIYRAGLSSAVTGIQRAALASSLGCLFTGHLMSARG